jgi:hypothetical protein
MNIPIKIVIIKEISQFLTCESPNSTPLFKINKNCIIQNLNT